MSVLKVVICIAALSFFLWLMVPSAKSKGASHNDEHADRARRRGFAMGYIMQRRKDDAKRR